MIHPRLTVPSKALGRLQSLLQTPGRSRVGGEEGGDEVKEETLAVQFVLYLQVRPSDASETRKRLLLHTTFDYFNVLAFRIIPTSGSSKGGLDKLQSILGR